MIYSEKLANKLYTYYTGRMRMKPYKGNWLKGNCPLCGNALKLGVNIVEARVNCFVCGSHKNPIHFIYMNEDLANYSEVYRLLKTFEETEYLAPKLLRTEQKQVELPNGFKLLIFGESEIAKMARAYIKRRGFNPVMLSAKGVGYCAGGDYRGCIILPYYQQGKLIYYTARRFIQLGINKFKNPAEEDFGIGKGALIYNVDALEIYKKVRVVESVFNAETIGSTAIGIGGKSISSYQLGIILKSPAKYISILLDPDAWDTAIKLALKLSEFKMVKLTRLPEGKDVNDLGRKKTLDLESQNEWLTYDQVYRLYLNTI